MKQGVYPIVATKKLSRTAYSITILCEDICVLAQVGQFIHIKVDGFLLRRPISICNIDKINKTITIAIETVGEGTKKLATLTTNNSIDIIGPIGNGFTLNNNKKAIIVGGGIGVAPLLPISKFYGYNSSTVLGFRSATNVVLNDDFKDTNTNLIITTDDGSFGVKGNVINSLKALLDTNEFHVVYTCGPHNMMRAISSLCHQYGILCEVSLEEKMGCGIGACLVCACSATIGGKEKMVHVCKDGPVFNSKEVF